MTRCPAPLRYRYCSRGTHCSLQMWGTLGPSYAPNHPEKKAQLDPSRWTRRPSARTRELASSRRGVTC
ncbi:unnamed protein product [Ectocarpus sp. 13 AM-2016]